MDRKVPASSNEEIALYIRTYYSLLRSSRNVKLNTLVESHMRMQSALHVDAESDQPDMAAFIYSILRLPSVIVNDVREVIVGQSEWAFKKRGFPTIESWIRMHAPARRRRYFFDGGGTLAAYIASRSDIDDLIPMLTAFQIERNKVHRIVRQQHVMAWLEGRADGEVSDVDLQILSALTAIPQDDLERLHKIWRDKFVANLLGIGRKKLSLEVRTLDGSLADYRRATRQWWENAEATLSEITFGNRPVYFVSSNTHSLANLLSGFALSIEDELTDFIAKSDDDDLRQEFADIQAQNVPSSRENFLYYAQGKYESAHPECKERRLEAERKTGIYRVPSNHSFDIEIQVFDLSQMNVDMLDPRLAFDGVERLAESKALVVNIDYPLGMAAYTVLSEISRNIAAIQGVYIIGKAATLNGRIGDVMIPSVVFDEHSTNTFLYENCISAESVAPHLVYGSVLDNQKAITVLGTFLQNHEHMSLFYHEGYTDMEMEAGPYLCSVYEMIRPKRYPTNEIVHLRSLPFPVGIVHYASDTPMSKGKNLGSQNLSYFGVDATYATTVAVLDAILKEEARIQSKKD